MIKNVYKAMIDYKTGKEQARKVYKQATDHIKANYVEGSELYRFGMDTAKDVFRKESEPLEGKYKEVIKADFEAVKKAIKEAVTTPPTAGVMNLLVLIEKGKIKESEKNMLLEQYKSNYMDSKLLHDAFHEPFITVEDMMTEINALETSMMDYSNLGEYEVRLLEEGSFIQKIDMMTDEFVKTYGALKGGEDDEV